MTETTTATTKAKTAKHAASALIPNFEMPKFDTSNMEMPEACREMTEKGVAHAKDTYAKAKVASEEAADLLQNTYAAVTKGATDYNLKLIEIARTNTRAAFDYAHELLGVKSPSEFIELSPRRCASNSTCFPRRTRSFARSLRRWRPRLPSQLRRACLRRSIRRIESQRFRSIGPATSSFRNNDQFSNPSDFLAKP